MSVKCDVGLHRKKCSEDSSGNPCHVSKLFPTSLCMMMVHMAVSLSRQAVRQLWCTWLTPSPNVALPDYFLWDYARSKLEHVPIEMTENNEFRSVFKESL
jgi:hypothetical protein